MWLGWGLQDVNVEFLWRNLSKNGHVEDCDDNDGTEFS